MMQNEDQHLAGFNDGYTIQKYEPELANQMLNNLDGVDEPYIKGFVAGVKEMILEKELEKSDFLPSLDQDIDLDISDRDLDQDLDLGKDNFDIDI